MLFTHNIKKPLMPALEEHPTILKLRQNSSNLLNSGQTTVLDATWLRNLCLTAGADDAGFVEIGIKTLEKEAGDINTELSGTRALIVISCRINRDNIRTPSRSIANTEFCQPEGVITGVSRKIVAALNNRGVRAVSDTGLFPLELDRWPGKMWDISLKPLAVAAGLGRAGVHRMVIHPKFGVFMYLRAVLVDTEISRYDTPLDYNPCLECELCGATCPTGAVGKDGHFDFFSCITHNYREKLGGFPDWVENIVDSKKTGSITGREQTTRRRPLCGRASRPAEAQNATNAWRYVRLERRLSARFLKTGNCMLKGSQSLFKKKWKRSMSHPVPMPGAMQRAAIRTKRSGR